MAARSAGPNTTVGSRWKITETVMKIVAFLVLAVAAVGVVLSSTLWGADAKSNIAAVKSVQTIRVRFLAPRSEFLDKIASILRRQIQERCGAVVKLYGAGELTVELALDNTIAKEGFRIEGGPGGAVRITGNNELALLYGVGKLLHTSRYDQGGFTPSSWRGTSVPDCPLRGVYFASHFGNWYVAAPQEEIEHYLEDMVLWGFNTWAFTLPVDTYADFNAPNAQKQIKLLRGLMAAAKRVGLKVAIGNAINNGLASVPKTIAGTQPPGKPLTGIVVCPSIPEGHEYLLRVWSQTMDAFADIGGGIDYIWASAYDYGGCGCEKCKPWASNAFLKISKDVLEQAKKKNPDCKMVLSTWMFDPGEWQGLADAMAKDKSWVAYIMGGTIGVEQAAKLGMKGAGEGYPQFPMKHGSPGNLPLVNFPEISMWGMYPWGAYGSNPQPDHIQKFWAKESPLVSGGLLYSEGIFEDINKAIYSQLFWKKDTDVKDVLREYIAYEYSPEVVDELLPAIDILEGSLTTDYNKAQRDKLTERVCQAYELVKKADAKLPLQARHSWRWRILYLRALIDCEMFKKGGNLEGTALKRAFDELTEIYHAENTDAVLKPPKLP
jgi:hypothetical protein